MNRTYKIKAFLMLAVIAITLTSTSTLTLNVYAEDNNISDWAKGEVSEAAELGILPYDAFEGDLTRPITRIEFARFSVFFLSFQYNMDLDDFLPKYSEIRKLKPDYAAFSDTDDNSAIWARAFKIVSGYEDGTFNPDADITRQEAAVMLLNTYQLYGMWELQEEANMFDRNFTDADTVAKWAHNAVMFMYQISVMGGVGDGTFAPLGKYTVEQSIITFLRLYENAPESRFNSNVTHFMTFDESLAEIFAINFAQSFRVNQRLDLEDCTVVYGELTGGSHGSAFRLWIVYKNGGRREILRRLPQSPEGWQNDFDIRDIKFDKYSEAVTFTRIYKGKNYYYMVDLKFAKLSEVKT